MENSPWNRLPSELRNKVYDEVICGGRILLQVFPAPVYGFMLRPTRARVQAHSQLALTHVCKAIRAETIGLFYSRHDFAIVEDFIMFRHYASELPCVVKEWLDKLGEHATQINEFAVPVPEVDLCHVMGRLGSPQDSDSDNAEWYERILTDWLYLIVSNGIPLRIT